MSDDGVTATGSSSTTVTTSSLPQNTCSFWIQRKSRNCKMQVKAGSQFCAEHLPNEREGTEEDPRIPCPLDPAHSVFTSKLKAHLKKCNAKDPIVMPSYFKKDINLINIEGEKQQQQQKPLPKTTELVDRIMRVASEILPEDLKIRCKSNDASVEGGVLGETEKHRLQQEALSKHILGGGFKTETDDKKVVIIEFGAGKAGLSSYLWESHFREKEGLKGLDLKTEFIPIDRSNSRCKKDAKMKHEGARVERIFIDIKDLDLAELLKGYDLARTVFLCVSKHLCGAATCLTINCIINYFKNNFRDLVNEEKCEKKMTLCVALCCHQCCSWQSYTNLEFLKRVGLIMDGEDVGGVFDKLKAITSWAVCGRFKDGSDFESETDCEEEGEGEGEEEEEEEEEEEVIINQNQTQTQTQKKVKLLPSSSSSSSQSATEPEPEPQKKEQIGRLMKRILDHGRALRLQEELFNLQKAEVKHYITEEVTLENAMLLAHLHI